MSRLPRALARFVPLLLALSVVAAGLPPTARAADDLLVTTTAHYELVPDDGRVRVTVDAVATSLTPDPPDARVYYTGMTFVVHPGVTAVSASSAAAPASARIIESTEDYTAVEVTFGQRVFYRQSYAFRFSFDLVDAGGAAGRDLRIRRSFAAFGVRAFGSPGSSGNRVEVVVPRGYLVTVAAGDMRRTTTLQGATVLSADNIGSPDEFFAYVTAEGRDAYLDTPLRVEMQETTADLLLQGWPDDPEWTERMRDLLVAGLPALESAIGIPYPLSGRLAVTENALSRLGDYAGFFDERLATIAVRYDVDAFVGLHEAAHIWFNGSLFGDRWIGEAFASFYAEEAGGRAGIEAVGFELTPDLAGHRFSLNAWRGIGFEDSDREDFAYAATNELGRQIADLATVDGLQAVWRSAFRRELPYQPASAGQPERNEARVAEGWQELLDLLEERTGADFDDVWLEWIVTDAQAQLLAERREAREVYRAAVTVAGDWDLPRSIRLLMSSWQFDDAARRLADAEAVLAERGRIESRAAALGLVPPDTLRVAFEGNEGLGAAANEARRQLVSLAAIGAASAVATREPTPLEAIGLLGADPAEPLERARRAYGDGELDQANAAAAEASMVREEAADRGRARVTVVGGGVLALDGLFLGVLMMRRRRSALIG